ncbi:hypothetical protein [Haloferula sp. BvORR071]|nr:hypothetical protein [Haloferula sp. BvORR071]
MNANLIISVFAGLSIAALSLQIIDDFYLPMLLGVIATIVIARLTR